MDDPLDHYQKYLELCYRYLGIRNRSEKEMRDYLGKKKAPLEVIEKIIGALYEQKFLNDEQFARAWVTQRARFRPRGKRALRMELQQKGINKELADSILAEDNEDRPDELTQAKALIVRRIEKLHGIPRQEIYNKVGAFLARRGYDWETIKRAIDESLQNSYNADEE